MFFNILKKEANEKKFSKNQDITSGYRKELSQKREAMKLREEEISKRTEEYSRRLRDMNKAIRSKAPDKSDITLRYKEELKAKRQNITKDINISDIVERRKKELALRRQKHQENWNKLGLKTKRYFG